MDIDIRWSAPLLIFGVQRAALGAGGDLPDANLGLHVRKCVTQSAVVAAEIEAISRHADKLLAAEGIPNPRATIPGIRGQEIAGMIEHAPVSFALVAVQRFVQLFGLGIPDIDAHVSTRYG